MKIVINCCYGGFSLSSEGVSKYLELKNGRKPTLAEEMNCYSHNLERTDEFLIKTVETLGTKIASGGLAELRVVEIPDNVFYEMDEYDGYEGITWSMSEIFHA